MQVSPEARCWGRGRRAPGDLRTRSPPPAPTGEPLAPITLAPHSRLSGPGPLGLTLCLSHSVRPGRPCSQPGLSTRAPAGPRGGGGWGEGRGSPASPKSGERLLTPGSPGMPGSWRPLPLPGTSRACSSLPSGTSLPATATRPGERLRLLSRGEGSGSREGAWGSPRVLGGASAEQMVTPKGQGARGGLVILAQSRQHLLSPWRPPSRGRTSLTAERGSHPKVMQFAEGRARKHILVPW